MESGLDPTVWQFIILLSRKLEETAIPSLFENQSSPTSNLLVHMLENHKLRSTYDFEQAVGRGLDLCNQLHTSPTSCKKTSFVWNFKMIDTVAGAGTAVDTIFELKKRGVLRGAKRKLVFCDGEKSTRAGRKFTKVEDVDELLQSLSLSTTTGKPRNCIRKKLSDTKAGWHGSKRSHPVSQCKKGKPETPEKKSSVSTGASKTPNMNLKKKCGKTKSTPGKGQSLMLDFIQCTPKGKQTTSGSRGRKDESPK